MGRCRTRWSITTEYCCIEHGSVWDHAAVRQARLSDLFEISVSKVGQLPAGKRPRGATDTAAGPHISEGCFKSVATRLPDIWSTGAACTHRAASAESHLSVAQSRVRYVASPRREPFSTPRQTVSVLPPTLVSGQTAASGQTPRFVSQCAERAFPSLQGPAPSLRRDLTAQEQLKTGSKARHAHRRSTEIAATSSVDAALDQTQITTSTQALWQHYRYRQPA